MPMASSNPQVRLNPEIVQRIDEWCSKVPLAVTRQAVVEYALLDFLERNRDGFTFSFAKHAKKVGSENTVSSDERLPDWIKQGLEQ